MHVRERERERERERDLLSLCAVMQDLCDIEDELETKLGVFKVHINGEQYFSVMYFDHPFQSK